MNTTTLIVIPIVLIVLYIGASVLWNMKFRPWRQSKGYAIDRFGGAFGRLFRFVFIEDNQTLLPKSKNDKIKKFVTWNTLYIVSFIATLVVAVTTPQHTWIPLIVFLAPIVGRAPKVLKARHQSLMRMLVVANSTFHYSRGAEQNPWQYIKVKKWNGMISPGETIIDFPASWMVTPGSKDTFETHFSQTVTEDNTWVYDWEPAKSRVTMRPVKPIPEKAMYPGSETHPWNKIPLGIGPEGEVFWDVNTAPHAGIFGRSGGGKSVAQRNIVFHTIQHSDKWCFLGVDPKRVELKPYAKYTNTVLGIATSLEDMVEVIRYAKEEMMRRYEAMEEVGVNHFHDLNDPPRAIMVMIDEAYMLMSPEGVKTDEGKQNDEWHGEASTLIGEILRLGRAAGVHIALAMQRPDATVLKGEFKNNLEMRVVAGRLDSTASGMALDNGLATRVQTQFKGRGVVSKNGEGTIYQGYFASPDWVDKWLMTHPDKEPEVYAQLVAEHGDPTAPDDLVNEEDISELMEAIEKETAENGDPIIDESIAPEDDNVESPENVDYSVAEDEPVQKVNKTRFDDASDFLPKNKGRKDDAPKETKLSRGKKRTMEPSEVEENKYDNNGDGALDFNFDDETPPEAVETSEEYEYVAPEETIEKPKPVVKPEPVQEIDPQLAKMLQEIADSGLVAESKPTTEPESTPESSVPSSDAITDRSGEGATVNTVKPSQTPTTPPMSLRGLPKNPNTGAPTPPQRVQIPSPTKPASMGGLPKRSPDSTSGAVQPKFPAREQQPLPERKPFTGLPKRNEDEFTL